MWREYSFQLVFLNVPKVMLYIPAGGGLVVLLLLLLWCLGAYPRRWLRLSCVLGTGGLLRADLSPKPAYERLLELIRQTWWTRAALLSNARGVCTFVGFLGDYEVTVQKGTLRQTVRRSLVKGSNDWTVTLD